jgi:hypothetical protein
MLATALPTPFVLAENRLIGHGSLLAAYYGEGLQMGAAHSLKRLSLISRLFKSH